MIGSISKSDMEKPRSKLMMSAEQALLERIGLPEEVELFEEFEELAKTYTIEAPFVARSQIELMFDVYDGRKLSQASGGGGGGGGAGNEINQLEQQGSIGDGCNSQQQQQQQQQHEFKLSLAASESPSSSANRREPFSRRSVGGLKAIARRGRRLRHTPNLTWCKLLFAHNKQHQQQQQSNRPDAETKKRPTGLRCCLSKSETGHDLWLSPSSSATSWPAPSSNNGAAASRAMGLSEEYLNAALESDTENNNNNINSSSCDRGAADKEEEAELKIEVLQLIGPLLHRLRRSSTLSLDHERAASLLEQQQQVILDGSVGAAGRISVCLFDMKNRTVRMKLEAENGRRWWRIESILEDLRWRFGQKKKTTKTKTNQLKTTTSRYFEQRHLSRASVKAEERCSREERLSRENFDRLIARTKDSLNHLIDAQLLLRNKLSSELQQQQQLQPAAIHLQPAQQQQCLIARENEYDALLRNNFNLLKVWQNLEETKRLACFVCEPIRANLADLFWFSRQRFAASSAQNDHDTASSLLSSPLVSLDAIQVKRGLIQVSITSQRFGSY